MWRKAGDDWWIGVVLVRGQNCPSNGVKGQPSEEAYRINQMGEDRERFLFPFCAVPTTGLEKIKAIGGCGGREDTE